MLLHEIFVGFVLLVVGLVLYYFANRFPNPISTVVLIAGILIAIIGIIVMVAGVIGIVLV